MTSLAIPNAQCLVPSASLPKPEPRSGPINVRAATLWDFVFIDWLQKKHSRMVGFARKEELEKKIAAGKVVIAEQDAGVGPRPIGYCIFDDRYFKREDCGIVYQLNVMPEKQRGLVGAALIRAVFERVPRSVKLFCCWCAQDLDANYFWESLGFVPLAFRTGSRTAGVSPTGKRGAPRIHIFWQRRVREGDESTPYWFPSRTSNGGTREERLVLPMMPGMHWRDAKPAVLPGMGDYTGPVALPGSEAEKATKPRSRKRKSNAHASAAEPPRPSQGLRLASAAPAPAPASEVSTAEAKEDQKKAKQRRPKPRLKNDPKYVAIARELCDRYLEEVNTGRFLPEGRGKYDVSRQLEAAPSDLKAMSAVHLLKAA